MFNKIILVGNLTRDIELRYAQSGTAIAKTAIATSRKFTTNGEKKEEVCFVDITFFGRSGEIANQYLRKGSKILVEGRLNFEQWVDQNGQKRSKHSVIAETMQMLDSKSDGQYAPTRDATTQGQDYDGRPTQHNQTGGYNPPPTTYEDVPMQQQQQQKGYNNQANTRSRQMPSPNSVPVIDIDEDEIPF